MFGSFGEHPSVIQFQDWFQGKPLVPRSPLWPKLRRLWLEDHCYCAVCGCTNNLNVHHIQPFHQFPHLELDTGNLITLGEACPTGNHHLLFGHLGDWRSWNDLVVEMCHQMNTRIINRPYSTKV